jgi:hypothetical protein
MRVILNPTRSAYCEEISRHPNAPKGFASLATADCAWMVLTTAVPGGARDSRANRHQNRRAADEREGNCGEQQSFFMVISFSGRYPRGNTRSFV